MKPSFFAFVVGTVVATVLVPLVSPAAGMVSSADQGM